MKSNFNDCVTRLLKDEGGYTNDPADSGGATNFGITITDYRLYLNKQGTPNDVRLMNVNDAKRIYKTKYWDAIGGDTLSSGVDYTCFDYAVHSGLGRPRKALGEFKSLKGTKLITAINNERTAFLRALAASRPKDQKFLKGWLNRVTRVNNRSIQMANGSSAGPVIGGATVTIGTVISQYFHTHQTAIIIGSIIAAAVGVAIYFYRKNINVKN